MTNLKEAKSTVTSAIQILENIVVSWDEEEDMRLSQKTRNQMISVVNGLKNLKTSLVISK